MKKCSVFVLIGLGMLLLSMGFVYGAAEDLVSGSHLWQENGLLLGIPAGTKAEEIGVNFSSGIIVSDEQSVVKTGMKISGSKEYTVVVAGDADGNGLADSTDLQQMKDYFTGDAMPEAPGRRAMDINGDGKISSGDFVSVKCHFNQKTDLYKHMSAKPYTALYERKEFDMSNYRMDRSRIHIGVFDFAGEEDVLLQDSYMKEFKEDFAGDFILNHRNEKKFYELCDKYEVGFFAKNLNVKRYVFDPNREKPVNGDYADFDEGLNNTYTDYNYLWGDDVFDEPTAMYYTWMQGATDRYNAKFTDRFIYFNLHPYTPNSTLFGYGAKNYKDYLGRYIDRIDTDYLSFDIYPFDNQYEGMHPYYLQNVDEVSTVCRESGRDFWIIGQAGTKTKETMQNKAQVSWQMYSSLAYGAKVYIHACYTPCWWADGTALVNENGTKSDLWKPVSELNKEIKAISDVYMQYDSLGVFAAGNLDSSFVGDQLKLQNERAWEKGIAGARGFKEIRSRGAVLVGSFAHKEGEGYGMMLVETTDPYEMKEGQTTKVTFAVAEEGLDTVTAYVGGAPTVLTAEDGVYTVELTSGQGCFVTVG